MRNEERCQFSIFGERKPIVSMDSVSLKYQGLSYSQTLLEVLEALLQMATNVVIVGISAPRGGKKTLLLSPYLPFHNPH